MAGPLVSFITPTYNRAYILGEALESIRAQTYPDWEAIVIDDGSTDNTKELVEGYGDDRIHYRYQENTGQIKARNHALDYARGEWIAYLDSDNTVFPEFLSVMRAVIQETPNTLWTFPKGYRYLELWQNGTMLECIDQTAEFPNSLTPRDIVHRKIHTDMNGFMHSRKILEDGIRFDEALTGFEDWDLFLTLAEKYPDNFLYVSQILYTYRQRFGGDGVVSNTGYRRMAGEFEQIYQKHKNDKLMEGQGWYPNRVEKWNKLADEFEKGLIPPYPFYYFKNHWPKRYLVQSGS